MEHILLFIFCIFGLILLIYGLKKSLIRYTLLSACSGIAALIATDLIGGMIRINVPLNIFSISISAIGGVPGVILLHILKIIFTG